MDSLTAGYPLGVAGTRWLDAGEQGVWRALIDINTRLLGRLDAELQETHDLTLADYEVLVHLSEAPERSLRMAELAGRLLLSPSGVTRRLDGLVRDGMVERRSCPSDRRGSLAVLTDAGLARLEQAAPTHVAGVRRYVIEAMSREQLLGLGASLDAIGHRLSRCPEDVASVEDGRPTAASVTPPSGR
jgi:DNA-binding MarR family transcriptional regulator